jgi:uncharacterized protein
VVVSCVNYVGVDANTASASLLTYVSGMNKRIANNFVKHREKLGKFTSRKQFMEVTGVGDKMFEQAAGFLKINPVKIHSIIRFIHPESYTATEKLLDMCNIPLYEVNKSGNLVSLFVKQKGDENRSINLSLGTLTLSDIIENLRKPGRDPTRRYA